MYLQVLSNNHKLPVLAKLGLESVFVEIYG